MATSMVFIPNRLSLCRWWQHISKPVRGSLYLTSVSAIVGDCSGLGFAIATMLLDRAADSRSPNRVLKTNSWLQLHEIVAVTRQQIVNHWHQNWEPQ